MKINLYNVKNLLLALGLRETAYLSFLICYEHYHDEFRMKSLTNIAHTYIMMRYNKVL